MIAHQIENLATAFPHQYGKRKTNLRVQLTLAYACGLMGEQGAKEMMRILVAVRAYEYGLTVGYDTHHHHLTNFQKVALRRRGLSSAAGRKSNLSGTRSRQ